MGRRAMMDARTPTIQPSDSLSTPHAMKMVFPTMVAWEKTLHQAATEAYRTLMGGRKNPGLRDLINTLHSSASYSLRNELEQLRKLDLARADDRLLHLTRKLYSYQRTLVRPIEDYLEFATRDINPYHHGLELYREAKKRIRGLKDIE